jgi:14-3-3 protein epsilon
MNNEINNNLNYLNLFEMSKSFDESIYLARVAEQADRFEDMIEYLQVLKGKDADLKTEERNLLSVAFKNAVG